MMRTDVVTDAFGYSDAVIARGLVAAGHQVRPLTGHPDRQVPRPRLAPPVLTFTATTSDSFSNRPTIPPKAPGVILEFQDGPDKASSATCPPVRPGYCRSPPATATGSGGC